MHRLFLILFLHAAFVTFGSDGNYAVSSINPALLKNANVVKRVEVLQYNMRNLRQASFYYKYAVTILNEKGDEHAHFIEWYDKLREISSVEGALYDVNGKLIKKLKPKDVQDLSAVDDISLMDDTRKKVHSFYHKVYPYTIEYEVHMQYSHTFHLPGWMAQDDEFISVEKSTYQVAFLEDYALRYKATNYASKPIEITEKGTKYLRWEVINQPAVVKEKYGPSWNELVTSVQIAPTQFEVQGYRGDMTGWTEFGKFIYELGKGRSELPHPVKEKVKQLTLTATSQREKVNVLYHYLQQNTRYISIQLGLGGWQPFNATYVATKGYGDCKALSNYMYSLLQEAGIPSYYTLIKAGDGAQGILEDFPSSQFNHAILCVPLAKDTIWLECTSQTTSSGYMGGFTGNRKALLIKETGGVLVNTPSYAMSDNVQTRMVKGTIDATGGLATTLLTRYSGLQQDNLHSMIHQLSKDKIKETLQDAFHLATYNVSKFNYSEKKADYPQIDEELQIEAPNYATITGKRMFINPNVFNQSSSQLPVGEERQQDVILTYEFRDVDSVILKIPEGYEAESVAKDVTLKTEFGTYSSTTKIEGTTITYIRVREQYKGRFPAKSYSNLVQFYSSIAKADKSKMVFVKKQ